MENDLKNNKSSEINYFAWIIGYELLGTIKEKNITECDLLYDFSNYVANNYIDSEEYKDLKYSGYEMFYKYIENNGGIEKIFRDYFNGGDND